MLVRAAAVPALPGQPAPETRATYQAKIEADIADMARYGVRPSAYAFEGWALLDMGYVRELIQRLRALGVRSVSTTAPTCPTTPSRRRCPVTTRRHLGYVATERPGVPYVFGSNGGAPATLLDFKRKATLEIVEDPRAAARRGRRRLHAGLRRAGAGRDGVRRRQHRQTMHNRYPVIFHRASRRIADAWHERHPERQTPWFFTRSGYSGRPGSAAYEMGNFPGDETADWSAGSGLRSLGRTCSTGPWAAPWYTTDIGGYVDLLTGAPDAELYTRWSEWSALTPYFRVHNSSLNGTRMPWAYGPEVLARWKSLAAPPPARAAADPAALAPGASHRHSAHAAALARGARGAAARTGRPRSGCSARTCWWPGGHRGRAPPPREPAARLLGGPGRGQAVPRPGACARGRAAGRSAVLLPLWEAALLSIRPTCPLKTHSAASSATRTSCAGGWRSSPSRCRAPRRSPGPTTRSSWPST